MSTEVVSITQDEAIEAADAYRKATLEKSKIEAQVKADQAKIAAKQEAKLAELTEKQDECTTKLKNYIDGGEILNDNIRSTDFAGLKVGYRKAAAKLVTTGKNTWEKVKEKLSINADWRNLYIKQKEEVDKTALKKADKSTLKSLGVKVAQEENFFIKL